jgi:cyanophycinase
MDLLSDPGFSDIADIMRGKFENGIPFGGTSAGMAIMSKEMFTGGENPALIDPTQPNFFRPGLGLIQGVMVDAHFIVRQRENRFFSYLLGHDIPLGFGIDEDGVMQVKDNVTAEVIGNKQVMVADMIEHPGDLLIKILRPGDVYDIPKRRRISEGVTGKVAPLCTAAHGSHIFSKSSGM